MCGIAGAVWNDERAAVSEDQLQGMIQVLDHRGPDDSGTHIQARGDGSGVALGHRRLSIIDLQGGRQPLANEDRTVWTVFNGEIYNYRELQPELEQLGHRFQTASDTEVIVHAYEQWGTDCLSRLRGMFAFAVWDQRQNCLFLARDRVGQKPMFYRPTDRGLAFASELKALLQLPDASREIDPVALDQFLTYQYVPYPRSILRGYFKLPPGHFGVYRNGQLQTSRYWKPPYDQQTDSDRSRSRTDWAKALRETLTEAVRLRMRSDVPLGAFLSGGVDSTIITGLMQQLSDQPVHSFSIGFPVDQFDERDYARQAARHLGTQHHESVVSPSALQILPRLIWHYDEPFADSSAIPTMALSEMTRQHVTVALSGDGGDELFAGYNRYRAVAVGHIFDRLPRVFQRLITADIWQRIPSSVRQQSYRRRLKRLLAALDQPPELRYLRWVTIFDQQRRTALYTRDFATQLSGSDASEPLLAAYNECTQRDFVTRTTQADVLTYLPGDILTKVDIASMAYSLECRSPLLDHHVVELAARMPIQTKLRRHRGKRILIEAFPDLLPESIQRRPKQGFGVPLDHWFRHELKDLIHDTLLDPRSLTRNIFDPGAVRQLLDEHSHRVWDHSARLWALLCLEMWQRLFLDGQVPNACPETL